MFTWCYASGAVISGHLFPRQLIRTVTAAAMQLVARVPRTTASQVAAKRICVPSVRQVIARRVCASSSLAQQRCEPCESAKESLDQMGLSMIMDRDTAQKYLSQVSSLQQQLADSASYGAMKGP